MNVGHGPAPSEPLAKAPRLSAEIQAKVRLPAWHRTPDAAPSACIVGGVAMPTLLTCGTVGGAGRKARLGAATGWPWGYLRPLHHPRYQWPVPSFAATVAVKTRMETEHDGEEPWGHPVLPRCEGRAAPSPSLVPSLIPRARGRYSATERRPQRGASRARQTEGNGNTSSVISGCGKSAKLGGVRLCPWGRVGEQVGVAW